MPVSIDEKILGEPKVVRIEQQQLQYLADGNNSKKLFEVVNYFPGGLKAQRHIYHADGTLSLSERYEYDEEKRLSKVSSFSQTGVGSPKVQKTSHVDPWTDETVTVNSEGAESDRSTTKRDDAGRVIEAISTNPLDDSQVHLVLRRDSQGAFTSGEAVLKARGEVKLLLKIVEQANNKMVVKSYQPDGKLLMKQSSIK